jgi:hypothetical protein
MKQTSVLERDAALDDLPRNSPPAGRALNITVIYHDAATQAWAREVHNRVAKLAGKQCVRATWWKISDLVEPGVLAGAVSTAMRADMIVVAIDSAEGLPFAFNVWVDTWLPHRMQAMGWLVALIGSSEEANGHSIRAREYLRAVARAGGFEFLLQERRLPVQTAPLFRYAALASRPNLNPVEVRSLVGVGRGIVHRAA